MSRHVRVINYASLFRKNMLSKDNLNTKTRTAVFCPPGLMVGVVLLVCDVGVEGDFD